jgi:prepilin-type N-terminal cleavage/methylation domain-containing protein
MLTFFNKRLHNKKGFTLIELIVVIAILGILIAIAVPRLGGFRTQAEDTASEANIRIIEGAAQMYYAEYNDFPDSVSALDDYIDGDEVKFSDYSIDDDGKITLSK